MSHKRRYRLIVVILSAYLIVCLVMFFAQRSMLFMPSREHVESMLTPWRHNGAVIGFCREVDRPRAVWLMSHGNAGQAGMRDYVLPHLPQGDSLLDKWDNVAALKDYQGPIEIYGARDDEVIPVRHARRLAEQLPRARYVELPGGHNDWSSVSNLQFLPTDKK